MLSRNSFLLLALLAFTGCQSLRVPSVDPTGARIFSGGTTNVALPDCRGAIPKPAFGNPPAAPKCPAYAAPPCGNVPGSILPAAQLRDQSYVVMMPGRVVAPVGSEVIVVSGICGQDGHYVMRQPLEWMISPDSVGHLMEVSNNKWCFLTDWLHTSDSKKLDLDWAKNKTHSHRQTVDRGTPALNDDVVVGKGQSWVSVMSPSEGASYITAMAPKEENWDRRRQTATIYWVDAQWTLPPHQIARVDRREPALLTTVLNRSQGIGPIEGWLVRYEVLDGPPAVFENNNRTIEVPSDINGQATVRLIPQAAQPGITQVSVQIIRPPSAKGDVPRMVVGQGLTSVSWSAPGLAVRASGPPTADAEQPVTYRVEVSNTGDVIAPDVVLAYAIPEGCAVINTNPPAAAFGNRLEWRLGNLPARSAAQAVEVTVVMRLQARYDHRFRTTSARGGEGLSELQSEAVASTVVNRSALVVRMAGPKTAPVGGEAQFIVEIENVSSLPATNVNLTDNFDPGLQHIRGGASPLIASIGRIEPGQKQGLVLTFIVRELGTHCHKLDVTADGGIKSSVQECVTATAEAPTPRVGVKMSGPAQLAVGEEGLYQIEVRNNGTLPLTDVRIDCRYSASLFLSALTQDGTEKLARSEVSWQRAKLAVGEAIIWEFKAKALRADPSARSIVTVSSPQGVSQAGEVTTQIAGGAAAPADGGGAAAPADGGGAAGPGDNTPIPGSLRLDVLGTDNPATVGRVLTYIIKLTNGARDSDQAVQVVIDKPEELEFVSIGPTPPGAEEVKSTRIVYKKYALVRGGETLRPIELKVRPKSAGKYQLKVIVTSARVPEGITEIEDTTVVAE
jgi:uncharacterized repeat protein (TIGR01451 family)